MKNEKYNHIRRYAYPERVVIRKGYKYINDCMCGAGNRWLHPRKPNKLICMECSKTISSDWIEVEDTETSAYATTIKTP